MVILYVTVLAVLLMTWLRQRSKSVVYPPGPPSDPVIGHARVMPLSYQHLTFADWGRKYGGIVYTKIFQKSIVIVNSIAVATELFEVRGANYSDRPKFALYGDLMGFAERVFLLRYGPRWRRQRRMLQEHFNSRSVARFRPIHQSSISVLLHDLDEGKIDFAHAIERSVISTIVMITYGYHLSPGKDKLVTLIEQMSRKSVEAGTPGTTLVDMVPILKHLPEWIPGPGFPRHAKEVRRLIQETEDLPYSIVMENVKSGDQDALQSVLWNLVTVKETLGKDNPQYEEDVKMVSMAVFFAGMETTSTALLTFVLAMVLNQSVLRKAQEEIDMVIGSDRLPTHDDRVQLPYLSAIVKETLRWNPPAPLGLPHASVNEDYYNGYFIPGGSMLMTNIWSMMRNEDLERPNDFFPERFLDDADTSTTTGLTVSVYGFGRRICPGRFFADEMLWSTIACLVSVFDIRPALDDNGKEIIPEPRFKFGTITPPEDFPCRITPRHDKAAKLIRKDLPIAVGL